MLCGRTATVLKIKWNRFRWQLKLWIWRNKYQYFYCSGCCIGCRWFNRCMDEFWDMKYHPEEYENGEGYYQQPQFTDNKFRK